MIIKSGYKDVANIIKSGQGFVNPIAEKANLFKQQALSLDTASLAAKAENIATKLNISNPSQFAADIASLPGKINDAMVSIDNFKGHVDQLSGVVLNGEKNLVSLLEIVKAAQETIKECSENPDDQSTYQNNPMYKVFGSVLNSGQHNLRFDNYQKKIKEINDFFHIDEMSDYLHSLPENEKILVIRKKIAEMKAAYDDIKGVLNAAKQADDDGYSALQNELLAQVVTVTLASLVGDRCANQVVSKVRSPELHKALQLAKKI